MQISEQIQRLPTLLQQHAQIDPSNFVQLDDAEWDITMDAAQLWPALQKLLDLPITRLDQHGN